MSKAVLVLDEMPGVCADCPFDNDGKCYITGEDLYWNDGDNDDNSNIGDDCPLKPLPDHKTDHTPCIWYDCGSDMVTCAEYRNGWNDCLEAVEGGGHEYCIFLEPMGEDNGSWFSQWIKHRDDLPQSTKDWLEAAGVEPGESVPMFTGGNAPVMRFKYKGMAEKTAEKIAEMYPQFEGKLHVQIYEEMPNNGPQE